MTVKADLEEAKQGLKDRELEIKGLERENQN